VGETIIKDMETKENNKYKPFNLVEAKAGKSVCTRGGHFCNPDP